MVFSLCACGKEPAPEKPDEPVGTDKPKDGPAVSETSFADVPTGPYYYEPVMWAVDNGITRGTGDGTIFSPDMICTRSQIVTFLYRSMD